jgi:hypothetical protein
MVEKVPQSLRYLKPSLHQNKQCIPGSKVERLGSKMIRESFDQGKAYPMNSYERTK